MISILEIKNLTKIYKNNNIEFKVFENLNFNFEEKSIYALVGKSTLSHIINMLELPSKGTICFNGVDICKLSDKEKKIRDICREKTKYLPKNTEEEKEKSHLELINCLHEKGFWD